MTNTAKQLLERVASWPSEDIEKLEEAAREIEAWRTGDYRATEDELRAIDEAIAELDLERRSCQRGASESRVREISRPFSRIDYAPRAIRDLEEIGAYYRAVATLPVAAAIAERLERVIGRLALQPQSAPRVVDRPCVRAVLVRRYP